MSRSMALKHPTRLYAEPLDSFNVRNEWALHAVDVDGNRLTIVASAERFRDALTVRAFPRTPHEQARSMYLRGEIEAEDFERALDQVGIPEEAGPGAL